MFGKRNRERLDMLEDMVVEGRYEIAKLKDEVAALKKEKCTCKKAVVCVKRTAKRGGKTGGRA